MKKEQKQPSNFDSKKHYPVAEACTFLAELSTSKFVGSVDIDVVLDVPEKHKKTNIAGSVTLPHQAGEAKKVIAFCQGEDVKTAKAAGATDAGLEDLVKKVEEGKIAFDVVVATPDVMPKIAKLGKVLGPKGLMPNPNNGTVTKDVAATISEFVSGKQNFKKSEQQVIRGKIAKLDMQPSQIEANVVAFLKAVMAEARKVNPQPLKKVTVSPTMGAGVRLELNNILERIV